jgi:hypothetical protein
MNLNGTGIYNGEVRQFSLDQFIGIFSNAINDDLCFEFIKWFNEISEQGITMSAMEEVGTPTNIRKDEAVLIPSRIPMHCFPRELCMPLWQNILECFDFYDKKYAIERPTTSHVFKIHRVQPTEGYHVWHHEHDYFSPYRSLAWMIILEAPVRGGETEFLYQSMRIEPKVGQLAIWPAGFTHKHRGNPPLEGQKTYLTGWFDLVEPTNQEQTKIE